MIKIIEAGGDPEELGHAVGRTVAASVHEAVIRHDEFQETADIFRGSDYLSALRSFADQAYPQHMRELTAMAAGIELDPETLFIWNCRGDLRLSKKVADAKLGEIDNGCTTLIAPAADDWSKPAVIAHNEDGAEDFWDHRYWLRAKPKDGPEFESFLYPGMLPGHSFAITSAGIVQTINNVRPNDLKPGIPRHFSSRAVLASENLMDVLSHLRRRDRASGFHHTIGIAGEAVPLSIEAPASNTVIVSVDKPRAHANHLLDDMFQDIDQVTTASSEYRQRAVEDYLSTGGDPTTPEDILFQYNGDGTQGVLRRNGDGGDDYGCTLATAIFKIWPDRIDWAVHADPDHRDAITGSVRA
jgi:hypothetical protein